MKALATIFKFEVGVLLRKNSLRIATIITVLIALAVTFVPRFLGGSVDASASSNPTSAPQTATQSPSVSAVYPLNGDYGLFVTADAKVDPKLLTIEPFSIMKKYDSEESLKADVDGGKIDKGVILQSQTSYQIVLKDSNMMENPTSAITMALTDFNINQNYIAAGLDPVKIAEAQNVIIQAELETLGGSMLNGFIFSYLGIFIVYMLVLLYGQAVATAVAREKDDRTMELLITNTTPTKLITGKVLACTTVSFIQVAAMLIALVVGIMINYEYYPPMILDMIKTGMQIDLIAVFLGFLIVGCLLYYFLYAAVGALVTRVEDVNSATTPIQFVFVGGFLAAYSGMMDPTGPIMKFASIFPFTSPLSMFARYSMSSIPVLEVLLAFGLLVLTTVGMAIVAIRIYRLGSLNYGNRMGLLKAIRMSFRKENL